MYNNYYSELYHFGIKGQKWGVRRYQNEDGSLTPEGYEHYGRKKRRLERSIDRSKKANQHIDYAQKFGRQLTAYQWETAKANAPITALGAAIFEGGVTAAIGADAAGIALASIGGLTVGGPGLLALTGLTMAGYQIVNKLLMYEHGKREKRVARQKQQINDISEKTKVYEKNLNHSELYHFGIKGQKWGVRRYQNPDGSLTPLGRQHYGYGGELKNTYNLDMDKETAKSTKFTGTGIKGVKFKENTTGYGTWYKATVDGIDMSVDSDDNMTVYDVKEAMGRANYANKVLHKQLNDKTLKENPEIIARLEDMECPPYDPKNWDSNIHTILRKPDSVTNNDQNLYSRWYTPDPDVSNFAFDIDFEWEKKDDNTYRLRSTAWND